MKVISLNILMGHEFAALTDFLRRESASTDVFCLQEVLSNPKEDLATLATGVRPNTLEELVRLLPEFDFVFAPEQVDFDITPEYVGQMTLGNATFYKKSLPLLERGSFFVYNGLNSYDGKDYETLGHTAVYLSIDQGSERLTIVQLHGNSQPADKLDSAKRLEQSQKVVDFLATREGEKIVMGDFNLLPETESIKMFAAAGYRNLIINYDVKTTRGSNMRRLNPEYEFGKYGFQEFADYAFVSPGVEVKSFQVPDLPVSDHLPLILEVG